MEGILSLFDTCRIEDREHQIQALRGTVLGGLHGLSRPTIDTAVHIKLRELAATNPVFSMLLLGELRGPWQHSPISNRESASATSGTLAKWKSGENPKRPRAATMHLQLDQGDCPERRPAHLIPPHQALHTF